MRGSLLRVLWAPLTGAGAIGCLAAYVCVAPAISATYRGFHPEVERLDGHDVRWARAYSKVDIRDLGWRPVLLGLTLRSHGNAPPGGTRIILSVNDIPVDHFLVGT